MGNTLLLLQSHSNSECRMHIKEKSRNNWSLSINMGKIVIIFVYKENMLEKNNL